MTDPRLALSFNAAPPVVFGRQLVPFSLAHCRTLDFLESPLSGCGHAGPLDFAETLLGVLICSRPAPVRGARLFRWRRGFLHRVRALWLCWRWGRHLRAEREKFLVYLEEAQSGPIQWEGSESRHSKLAPWWALYTRLRAAGYNESEAWATSPGLAAWLTAGADEAAGYTPEIVGEAEAKALREAGHLV